MNEILLIYLIILLLLLFIYFFIYLSNYFIFIFCFYFSSFIYQRFQIIFSWKSVGYVCGVVTFIIIESVIALKLEGDAAVDAFPALVATAAPLTVRWCRFTRAVFGTLLRAALESAVLPVPARHAQAGAVLALPVLVATVQFTIQ